MVFQLGIDQLRCEKFTPKIGYPQKNGYPQKMKKMVTPKNMIKKQWLPPKKWSKKNDYPKKKWRTLLRGGLLLNFGKNRVLYFVGVYFCDSNITGTRNFMGNKWFRMFSTWVVFADVCAQSGFVYQLSVSTWKISLAEQCPTPGGLAQSMTLRFAINLILWMLFLSWQMLAILIRCLDAHLQKSTGRMLSTNHNTWPPYQELVSWIGSAPGCHMDFIKVGALVRTWLRWPWPWLLAASSSGAFESWLDLWCNFAGSKNAGG